MTVSLPDTSESRIPPFQILISSEDIRQFIYCPRIPFFRTILRYSPRSTAKMGQGRQSHADIHQFSLPALHTSRFPDRYINIYLQVPHLGIHGQIDMIEILDTLDELDINPNPYVTGILKYEGTKAIGTIVEIKTGKIPSKIPSHHKAQVVFQALLVEANFQIRIFAGKIFYSKGSTLQTFNIWTGDKRWITGCINKLRTAYQTEIIPLPTPHEKKCHDCEYWPVCQRV